jgi:hypothetical protein
LNEKAGKAIPTATSQFLTMPDSDMASPTWLDINRHPKLKMAATKPEVEITFERKELAKRFPSAPPTFSTMHDSDMALPTRSDMGTSKW